MTGIAAAEVVVAEVVVADKRGRKAAVTVRSSRKAEVWRRSRYGMVAAEEAGVSVV